MTGILINVHFDMMGETSPAELGRALLWYVAELIKLDDDAGCDWYTRDNLTCIAHDDWVVSSDPDIAALVRAANILINTKG